LTEANTTSAEPEATEPAAEPITLEEMAWVLRCEAIAIRGQQERWVNGGFQRKHNPAEVRKAEVFERTARMVDMCASGELVKKSAPKPKR
jgi:hypothetical protein